jgi:putative acyl-CoA dehydrogenase
VQHAPSAVADAFCAGRFSDSPAVFGTLPRGLDLRAILERATPTVG